MRDSGCLGLILGLESPRAGTLAAGGQAIRLGRRVPANTSARSSRYGISIWGSFIFGFDSDDWRDCMDAVRFAQRANLCMSCYPSSDAVSRARLSSSSIKAEGRLLTRGLDPLQRRDGGASSRGG